MLYFVFLVDICKLATDFSPTPVRPWPWPCPRVISLGLGLGWSVLVLGLVLGQSPRAVLGLGLDSIVRPCPWPCPRLARPRHNTLILHNRCSNFRFVKTRYWKHPHKHTHTHTHTHTHMLTNAILWGIFCQRFIYSVGCVYICTLMGYCVKLLVYLSFVGHFVCEVVCTI